MIRGAGLRLAGLFLLAALGPGPALLCQDVIVPDSVQGDSLKSYRLLNEVIVRGGRGVPGTPSSRTLPSTDALLSCTPGVHVLRRAGTAAEASIRGMSAGRIAVTIDGMHMHGACIDRMDPITSYVEVEDLESLRVASAGDALPLASTIGGALALVSVRPGLDAGAHARVESGYESNASLRFLRGEAEVSSGDAGLRLTGSARRAGDYAAGGGTTIHGSGYAKENAGLDARWNAGGGHTVGASGFIDVSRNTGFPALIMDARRTSTWSASVDDIWLTGLSALNRITMRLYANRVMHWMDDYARPVEEINARKIMPGMYMPMFGETRVQGGRSEALLTGGRHATEFFADIYHLEALADMRMIGLTPGSVPMYLLNIGDADVVSVAAGATHTQFLGSGPIWRTAVRAEWSQSRLLDDDAVRTLSLYWNADDRGRRRLLVSVHTSLEFALGGVTVRTNAGRVQRPPTHIENFGYFLYSPADNSILMGNPLLDPERSWIAEVQLSANNDPFIWNVTAWLNSVDNMIIGRTIIPGDASNPLFPQVIRRFENAGHALLRGFEARLQWRVGNGWEVRGDVSGVWGDAQELRDPLPKMSPLEATCGVQYMRPTWWAALSLVTAARQDRVSTILVPEESTPGFATLDLRGGVRVMPGFNVRWGVENCLDARYSTHLSEQHLPLPGRNFQLGVSITVPGDTGGE